MRNRSRQDVSARTRTILVIDDDRDTRTLLCRWLEEQGFNSESENNGHSGLSRLTLQKQRGPIDGIVLDLHMPFFDGAFVLGELLQQYPELPVIVTIETQQADEARKAVRMGARALVLKPVDHADFRHTCAAIFLSQAIPD